MGKDIMREHQSLRETLENTHQVDLGLAIEFTGSLNARRRELGYRFKQFDERDWGYMFDDMQSEDDGSEQDDEHWDYYAEALDPSSYVVLRPTADSAIASLPRKQFADVTKAQKDTECLICKDIFEGETSVVELPCGHLFCESGCIETWLKQFNNCPTCRRKLPAKETVDADVDGNSLAIVDSGAEDGQSNDGMDGVDEQDGDGDDMVMSDVDDAIAA